MTTKEEVLRLAEEAGFDVTHHHYYGDRIFALNQCKFDGNCNADVTEEITKLIELAKAQGADEERDKDKSLAERIHYPDCWDTMAYPSLAYALYEMTVLNEVSGDFYCTGDECQLAIRNRESKS